METHCILLFTILSSCLGEWVLLSTFSPKQNESKKQFSYREEFPPKNISKNPDFCPDFHNLTTMSYGTVFKEEVQSRGDWEVAMEDVEEILMEREKLPKAPNEKANFMKGLGEKLMIEAEERIKMLFAPTREARTKYFHFASMESSLMTISLLLFGVYLSKLITKLLVSHYNRYNGGVTMMTGIRRPITLTQGRRRRSMELEEINLMRIVDKYNTRFN